MAKWCQIPVFESGKDLHALYTPKDTISSKLESGIFKWDLTLNFSSVTYSPVVVLKSTICAIITCQGHGNLSAFLVMNSCMAPVLFFRVHGFIVYILLLRFVIR